MATVDYLIRGGHVIDLVNETDDMKDIAVRSGKIVSAEGADALEVVNAEGCFAVPGLIDFHCHVADCVTELGIPAEYSYFPMG